jgi:hypothetical protein
MTGPAPLIHAQDTRLVYEQYPHLIQHLAGFLRPLQLMPLDEMAVANERMQALAPFFAAPIQYHAGARNLSDQRRVIDAAAALQRVLLDLSGMEEPREFIGPARGRRDG